MLPRVRAWWLRRQGLTSVTAPRTLSACLQRIGWLPTAGSACTYLSIRARMRGVSREAIDRAVIDATSIAEAPGGQARGAVLVAREELALAIRLAQASHAKHQAPQVRSGAIDPLAIRSLRRVIQQVLDEGPKSAAAIRSAVFVSHPRSLELLSPALASLTLDGMIRRFSIDGRIDSPKYMYEAIHPDDRPDLEAEGDLADVMAKLATLFLRRHGPATVEDFVWWAGCTKGEGRAALKTIGAEPIAIERWAANAWLLPEDVQAWQSFQAPAASDVVLLPFRDPFVYARRPPAVLAADPQAPVLDWKARPAQVGDIESLHHHAIIASGTLVGVWEYDRDAQAVVTRLWSRDRALASNVASAADDTGRFIRDQVGDLAFYAADTAASRAPRLAFCRPC
jgi:hypothetical protein